MSGFPSIPEVPRLKNIVYLNLALGAITLASLVVPIRLSLQLSGLVVSSGPTTILVAPSQGLIGRVPRQGVTYAKESELFTFEQPLMAEDMEAAKRELANIKRNLSETLESCKRTLEVSKQRLRDVDQVYQLNFDAYRKSVISRLQLYQAKGAVSSALKDLEDTRNRCRQEEAELKVEIGKTQDRLNRIHVDDSYKNILSAPSSGTVFSVVVKEGQHVAAGQELARFVESSQTVAELKLQNNDRPFVFRGQEFEITSPTYSFVASPPTRKCVVDNITPDRTSTTALASDVLQNPVYIVRCIFATPSQTGDYPLLIGMSLTARSEGIRISLMQLLLKGYRAGSKDYLG